MINNAPTAAISYKLICKKYISTEYVNKCIWHLAVSITYSKLYAIIHRIIEVWMFCFCVC